MPTTADVREYTGLTVDEVIDSVLTNFLTRAGKLVKSLTGKAWLAGEEGFEESEEATIFFSAQRAFLRAGMIDRAKAAEDSAYRTIHGLLNRIQQGPYTR